MSLSDRPCPASALFTQLFRLSLLLSSCFLFFLFVLLFHFHVAVVSFFFFLLLWLEPRLTSRRSTHVLRPRSRRWTFHSNTFFLGFLFRPFFFKNIYLLLTFHDRKKSLTLYCSTFSSADNNIDHLFFLFLKTSFICSFFFLILRI